MGLFKKLFGGDDASSKDNDSKGAQDENVAAKDAKELSLLLARAVLGAPPNRPCA